MSFCIVASCTPCVGPAAAGVDQIRRDAASDTSSRCGHLVILMRRRSSVTSASGKLTWNERIAVLSGMGCSCGVWVEGDGVRFSAVAGYAMAFSRCSHRQDATLHRIPIAMNGPMVVLDDASRPFSDAAAIFPRGRSTQRILTPRESRKGRHPYRATRHLRWVCEVAVAYRGHT